MLVRKSEKVLANVMCVTIMEKVRKQDSHVKNVTKDSVKYLVSKNYGCK